MPEIVLATLNAKFIHAAFGLRYLFANLGELQAAGDRRGIRHQPAAARHCGKSARAESENHRLRRLHLERCGNRRSRGRDQTRPAGNQNYSRRAGGQLRNRRPKDRRAGRPRHHRRGGFEICGSVPVDASASSRRKSFPPSCRTFRKSFCLTIYTPTPTSRIASFTSRRRAAVRSRANFACRRSTFRCGRRRWKNFWRRCKSCSTAA